MTISLKLITKRFTRLLKKYMADFYKQIYITAVVVEEEENETCNENTWKCLFHMPGFL